MATDRSHRVIMGENVVNTLVSSFSIGSFSYLQVTRTFITSRTSSKFGQIGPRTAELAAIERVENSSFIFYSVNLILAGNEDMHDSLDEFKFRPDTTANSRVICPCMSSEKLMSNFVNTLEPTFSIGFSSFS